MPDATDAVDQGGLDGDVDMDVTVCPLCRSWRPPESPFCESCLITGSQVDFPVGPASVITMVSKPSHARDWMTRYKGRVGDPHDPYDPTAFAMVRAILGRYLLEHGGRLAEVMGRVDVIVVPPSARDRPAPHPLETVLRSLDLPVPVAPMLDRGPGSLRWLVASRDGFVLRPVAGLEVPQRVLLIDDIFVTGAHVFSAARTLLDGGHEVAGLLTIARRINRDYRDCEQLWQRQRANHFAWDTGPLTLPTDDRLLAYARTLPPVQESDNALPDAAGVGRVEPERAEDETVEPENARPV